MGASKEVVRQAIIKVLKRHDALDWLDLIDFDAYVDTDLSLRENIQRILALLKDMGLDIDVDRAIRDLEGQEEKTAREFEEYVGSEDDCLIAEEEVEGALAYKAAVREFCQLDPKMAQWLRHILVSERAGRAWWEEAPELLVKELLGRGIIEEHDDGYRLVDPDAVEVVLSELEGAGGPQLALAPSEVVKFEEFLKGVEDPFTFFARLIAPKVRGMEEVKKSVLLSLISPDDVAGDRLRVHVLMVGEPGTGKTAILEWVSNAFGALYCTQETTEAGLAGDARGNEITYGALPLSDRRPVCIDELSIPLMGFIIR